MGKGLLLLPGRTSPDHVVPAEWGAAEELGADLWALPQPAGLGELARCAMWHLGLAGRVAR